MKFLVNTVEGRVVGVLNELVNNGCASALSAMMTACTGKVHVVYDGEVPADIEERSRDMLTVDVEVEDVFEWAEQVHRGLESEASSLVHEDEIAVANAILGVKVKAT